MANPGSGIFFRVDGGRSVGMGHVMRCLSLARILRERYRYAVSFCMNQDEVGISRVQSLGFPVVRVGADDFYGAAQGEALIIDLPGGAPAEVVRSLRAEHPQTLMVLMDGTCSGRLEADLVISPLERLPDASSWTGFRGQRYEGPAYAIVDPAFAQIPRRTTSVVDVPHLLVTMGASDPCGLTLQALRALDAMPEVFHTTVAVGPAFLHDPILQSWLTGARRHYEIRREDSLLDLMTVSDLAVVSFGTTVYELAAAGLPAIALSISEDHAQSAEIFAGHGSLITLGLFSSVTSEKIKDAVQQLINDPAPRLAMTKRGQSLVDRHGAERVAELLVSRIKDKRTSRTEERIGTSQRA